MRIATKLYLGFGVLLSLLGALGALVAYDISGVQKSLGRLRSRDVPGLRADLDLARDFSTYVSQTHFYLVGGEKWRLAEARSAKLLMDIRLNQSEVAATPPELRGYDRLEGRIRELDLQAQQVRKLSQEGQVQKAVLQWDAMAGLQADIASDIETVRSRREQAVLDSAVDLWGQSEHLRTVSQYVVLIALFGGIVAAWLITHGLLVPIRKLVRTVDRIAEGDLGARVEWPASDELGLLAADFNRMAERLGTTFAQLDEAHRTLQERNEALGQAYTTIQQEIELAARIQREILPQDCGSMGMIAAADLEAASDIGGDFYDILYGRPTPETVAMVVGDISGHGIAAALLMVYVVTILREICRRDASPSEILSQLNQLVLSRFGSDGEMYATCFLGMLDRESLRYGFAKAGHEEPLWYRSALRTCEYLSASGLFVGLFTDGMYETRWIQVEPEDKLVLYTDGIVEARSPGGTMFGSARLRELVERCGHGSVESIITCIRRAIAEWTNESVARDDMTLLIVEIPQPMRREQLFDATRPTEAEKAGVDESD